MSDEMSFGDLKPAAGMQQHLAEQEDEIISPIAFRKGVPRPDEAEDNEDVLEQLEQQAKALQIQGSNRPLSGAFAATTTTTIGTATTNLLKMDRQQEVKAQAAEALAKNYALKLDVVKQIEDFEIARREYYDHKRESNAMYWMAFTLVMKRSKSENTRYLDFFSRKVAAENTYVRCILEMKEESEKLKHGGGHKSTLETAFGAAKKNMLDDLLGVQEQMVEQVHAFGKVIEGEIVPQMEGMITTFNMAVELILVDGETYLEDIELAEGNVQQAYKEYRDQAEALEKMGMNENGLDLWVFEMQYRVAVGVLLETWGVCSSGLGGLFTRMKDTEMTRRQAIHTALGTLHDQQTAYWKKLPELGFTFSSLVHSRVADPGLIEKEIGADIRTGAQRLQQSEEGKRRKRQIMANRPVRMFTPTPAAMAAMGGMSTNGLSNTLDAALPLAITMNAAAVGTAAAGGGVGAEVRGSSSKKRVAKEFGHVLQGPLGSPLTKRVQVFERKTTNVFKPWKPALAVMTVDNYLHVFDLPSNNTKAATAATAAAAAVAAQEAFDSLVAKPETVGRATGALPLSGTTTNLFPTDKESGKKTLGMVSPSLTFNLALCKANFKSASSVKDMSFEIVEVGLRGGGPSTGFKKVFKDLAHKRVVAFKGRNKEEMTEWCKIVDALNPAAVGAK